MQKKRVQKLGFTLLLPDRDHKMDSDKLGHAQTWEFWCDNTVHTVKRISKKKIRDHNLHFNPRMLQERY